MEQNYSLPSPILLIPSTHWCLFTDRLSYQLKPGAHKHLHDNDKLGGHKLSSGQLWSLGMSWHPLHWGTENCCLPASHTSPAWDGCSYPDLLQLSWLRSACVYSWIALLKHLIVLSADVLHSGSEFLVISHNNCTSAVSDNRISESILKKTRTQHHWLTLTPLK